jgi:hypothetical protein
LKKSRCSVKGKIQNAGTQMTVKIQKGKAAARLPAEIEVVVARVRTRNKSGPKRALDN